MQRSENGPVDKLHAAFLVDTAPQFAELNRVARVLNEAGWVVTFVFDGTYRAIQRDMRTCRNLGYGVVSPAQLNSFLADIRSHLSRAKANLKALLAATASGAATARTGLNAGVATIGSWLAGASAGMRSALGLWRKPAANDSASEPATPLQVPVHTVPTYFSVPPKRLLVRHSRMRIKRWKQTESLRTLPKLVFDITGTVISMTPTVAKWTVQVWLPYKWWLFRSRLRGRVRLSRFDPVWGLRFIAITLIPYWHSYLGLLLLRFRMFRRFGKIEGPAELPGLDDFSQSNLNRTPADFEILRIKQAILRHQELLLERQISLLMLAKDCAYYQTGFWVEAARQLNIPTVLIPFDDADTKALAEHRSGHKDHLLVSDYAEAIAEAYPKWVLDWGNERLILLPPELVEARERLGLTPPNPWGYNSTRCDRVLVESEAKRQKLLAEKAEPEQIVVTGTIFHDMLAQNVAGAAEKRKALLKQLKLKDDRPLVLGSVTPDKIAERSVTIDFTNYREMLTYWISQLTQGNRFNVILCLHPSVDAKDVAFLERHGARIVRQDTASLIPLCDIYVVDCSATSRWALATGKLVIDYDLYRYDLAYHSKLPGIIHVLEQQDFEAALDQLAEGKLDQLRQVVMTSAQNHLYGRLDGAAAERIEATCRRLVQDRLVSQ